jgi:hypothetical protein
LFLWIVIWICFVSADFDLDMLCLSGLWSGYALCLRIMIQITIRRNKAYPDHNPQKQSISRSQSTEAKHIQITIHRNKVYPDRNPQKQSISISQSIETKHIYMLCFCGLWSGYALFLRIVICLCFVFTDHDLDMLCQSTETKHI